MMKAKVTFISHSSHETVDIGRALSKYLRMGDIVALLGDLGSGKTCFVKGVAIGLGIDERYISSPSYVITNKYPGEIPISHIDLYRIIDPEEIENMGILEMMERPDSVFMVEWAERAAELLPTERIDIRFEWVDGSTRKITVAGYGKRFARIVEKLRNDRSRP